MTTPSWKLRSRGYATGGQLRRRSRPADMQYDFSGARALEREFEREFIRPKTEYIKPRYKHWGYGAAAASFGVAAKAVFDHWANKTSTNPRGDLGAFGAINNLRREDGLIYQRLPKRRYTDARAAWRDLHKNLKDNGFPRNCIRERVMGRTKYKMWRVGDRIASVWLRDNVPDGDLEIN